MLKDVKKNLIWYIALVAVILATAFGAMKMTERINYEWYWGRVPQYFVFSGDEDQFADGNGEAVIEEIDMDQSKVILEYDNGEKDTLILLQDSLMIEDGDSFSEGDKIGAIHVVRTGILIEGLITTLELSLYSGIIALIIGLFIGLARVSKNPLFRGLASIYVEVIRGTPLLVQIFIFYFFVGTVLDFSRFTAGTLALAIFAGAYVGEIIRAGIQAVDKGQMEAARSLGMNYMEAMIHIIMPQALKRVLPPLAGQFISLIKDSSLVSVIAITDLTKAGREVITSTFATFEIWFTIAGMYLVLTFTLSMIIRYIERRFSVSD
ncbi:MAG: ABC transporter permease [SAR324 cluster bacterium]|uniref:ABC transporter permease n=1 Tax=SAR324 cluster bacterium TaxID=2024889 RepID=A0A2A4T843_9DELT|nr:MAG: ABC transporter permease [SAR324 cluster bacterium]